MEKCPNCVWYHERKGKKMCIITYQYGEDEYEYRRYIHRYLTDCEDYEEVEDE